MIASLFDGLWEVLRGFSVLFLFAYLTWAIANKFEVARAKDTARKHNGPLDESGPLTDALERSAHTRP